MLIEIIGRNDVVVAKGDTEKGLSVVPGVPLGLAPFALFWPSGMCDIDAFDDWLRTRLAPASRLKNEAAYKDVLSTRDKLYALISMTRGAVSHGDPFTVVFKTHENIQQIFDPEEIISALGLTREQLTGSK